ncbi:MAG TPA: RAMP superfamily CRISPR-associated protein [Roseiflexaceae bacterium]|nr:RAMP superfamily CRISPR-associated protein [Roseiflexaceae bacterium]
MRYYLSVLLDSDATFGRGEGVAGLVNVEITHDSAGCPFLGGRALKGLLRESWHEIRDALERSQCSARQRVALTAARLLGESGAGFGDTGGRAAMMRVQAATLPPSLRSQLHTEVAARHITPTVVLDALTTIRRQTARDPETGAPAVGALRAMRVLLRDTALLAALDFTEPPQNDDLALLAAIALGVRRAGTARNRGRGRIRLLLHTVAPDGPGAHDEPEDYADSACTHHHFAAFAALVKGAAGHAAA